MLPFVTSHLHDDDDADISGPAERSLEMIVRESGVDLRNRIAERSMAKRKMGLDERQPTMEIYGPRERAIDVRTCTLSPAQ